MAGNGLFYPLFGFASIVLLIYMSFGDVKMGFEEDVELSFVERKGSQFVLDGKAFYINGWNSYWFMVQSVDYYTRPRVSEMLRAGAKMGLTVCRTWAFNDGDYNALQTSPGVFDEEAFRVFLTRAFLVFMLNFIFCFCFGMCYHLFFVFVFLCLISMRT